MLARFNFIFWSIYLFPKEFFVPQLRQYYFSAKLHVSLFLPFGEQKTSLHLTEIRTHRCIWNRSREMPGPLTYSIFRFPTEIFRRKDEKFIKAIGSLFPRNTLFFNLFLSWPGSIIPTAWYAFALVQHPSAICNVRRWNKRFLNRDRISPVLHLVNIFLLFTLLEKDLVIYRIKKRYHCTNEF